MTRPVFLADAIGVSTSVSWRSARRCDGRGPSGLAGHHNPRAGAAAARENANGVAVTFRTKSGEESFQAEWLIGCDGAHSTLYEQKCSNQLQIRSLILLRRLVRPPDNTVSPRDARTYRSRARCGRDDGEVRRHPRSRSVSSERSHPRSSRT
jgi:hypothetical protein